MGGSTRTVCCQTRTEYLLSHKEQVVWVHRDQNKNAWVLCFTHQECRMRYIHTSLITFVASIPLASSLHELIKHRKQRCRKSLDRGDVTTTRLVWRHSVIITVSVVTFFCSSPSMRGELAGHRAASKGPKLLLCSGAETRACAGEEEEEKAIEILACCAVRAHR